MCTTTKAGSCLHGCPLIPVQLCTPQHHWWSGLSLHILFFRGQITLQSQESYVSGKFLAFCLGGRGRAAEGGEESCCLWGFPVDGEAGRLWLCFSLLSRPSLYIVQSYLSNNTTLGEWDCSFFLEVFCAVCTPLVRSRLSQTALAAWDEMATMLLQAEKKHKHEQ